MEFLTRLLEAESPSRGLGHGWHGELPLLHLGGDLLIGLACYSIALALVYVYWIRRGEQVRLRRTLLLFGAFMFACGTAHLMQIGTIWYPVYRLEGWVKVGTAALSAAAALGLWSLVRKIAKAPSSRALEEALQGLRDHVLERGAIEDRLRRVNEDLAEQVAERERAEEEVRGILESAPDAMVVVDGEGRIEMVNAQLVALFGHQRRDLLGRSIEVLVPPLLRERHREHRRRYANERVVRPMGAGMELAGVRSDGTEFPVEISLSPIHTQRGVLVSAAIRDSSERVKQAARLRRVNEELEQRVAERTRELQNRAEELARSNEELEQFAHVISHDLKSPMRGVSLLAEWIGDDYGDALDDEGKEQLQLLRERTRRLHLLVDGVLEYSRATRRSSQCECDVAEILANVVDILSPPEGIETRVEVTLPRVIYDRAQLMQVFQNLIGNAIQHMGKAEGHVAVRAEARDGAWEFSVRDTGVGISSEHHDRIFRMFQTLKTSRDDSSTGIGLAVVKKIVESNGGRIWVVSAPGEGADFRFTVPRR